jgi:UDP-N-acetylmuramate--alanine ligase
VDGASVVVVSTAIKQDNPELLAARELRIPVVRRAEMLAELMRFRHGIAIAGPTARPTTSLVASIYAEADRDRPSSSAVCSTAPAPMPPGQQPLSDCRGGRERRLLPASAADGLHRDQHRSGSHGHLWWRFSRLKATFIDFLHNLPFYGLAVVCVDDRDPRHAAGDRPSHLTYGLSDDADVQVLDFVQTSNRSRFRVRRAGRVSWR